ncbi:hypothetical protein M8818_003940 [Zalaria obscura]|uniref:Uncharacterized protein n=1 Tax=Zalaria obscura TaxID=2024903 RepID=A0ACC3SDJ0_9PEZI
MPRRQSEDVVVTRARRVIDATVAVQQMYTTEDGIASVPSSYKKVRKSRSMFNPSAPYNQHHSSTTEHPPDLHPSTPQRIERTTKPLRASYERKSYDFSYGSSPSITLQSPRASVRETQTEDQIKAIAWDAYLQDFHQRKVRQRSSFIDPIKKRLAKTTSKSEVTYDSSLPPFNSAAETDAALTAAIDEAVPPVGTSNQKPRVISDSLKDRFRRIIGRPRRAQTDFPAQHVEAQRLHFDTGSSHNNGSSAYGNFSAKFPTPMHAPPSPPGMSSMRVASGRSAGSGMHGTEGGSRVTSWTDSTIAGTVRTRGGESILLPIEENVSRADSDDGSKQRQGSLFGRALRLSSRRHSRAQLTKSADESQKLYEALQQQIRSSRPQSRGSVEAVVNGSPAPLEKTTMSDRALRTPVSEVQCDIPRSRGNTIRTVTPDEPILRVQVGTPPSPQSHMGPADNGPMEKHGNSYQTRPGTASAADPSAQRLHEKFAAQVTSPSKDTIAKRIQRSHNRWQHALDEMSPIEPRAERYSTDNNPYVLPPFPTEHEAPLPFSIRHPDPAASPAKPLAPPSPKRTAATHRECVISPSVYSQAQDAPRSETPLFGQGTMVTVTGREVKRYSLESPQKNHSQALPLKPSHDWKNWLFKTLDQMQSSPEPPDFTLTASQILSTPEPAKDATETTPQRSSTEHHRENAQRFDSDITVLKTRKGSSSPPSLNAPKQRRPKPKSRSSSSSSYMNDRFPMINTGRRLSSKGFNAIKRMASGGRGSASGASSNTASIAATSSPLPQEPTQTITSTFVTAREQSLSPLPEQPTKSSMKKPRSMAYLSRSHRPTQPSSQHSYPNASNPASVLPPEDTVRQSDTAAKKAKSAFDLRATYREKASASNLAPSNINIRRKPITATLLEDHTLRRISEGPYASEVNLPTEASGHLAVGKENRPSPITTPAIEKQTDAALEPSPLRLRTTTSRSSIRTERGRERAKASPSQKMVDDFLSTRRREKADSSARGQADSPAFL